MMELSQWWPLTRDDVDAFAPDAPAAVQLRRGAGLIHYPTGKSAMVFYFYAARSARQALVRLFADELENPGARGEGPLLFRFTAGGDDVRVSLEELFTEFVLRFGSAPRMHADDPGAES